MEIVEAINPKDNVKGFIEEKLKKTVNEVTPYKKQLVQNSKITRFLNQHTISSIGNIVYLDLVSLETKHKLLKNKIDKYMLLGIILIRIIGLHHKENGALININLLDTRNICHILWLRCVIMDLYFDGFGHGYWSKDFLIVKNGL